jgi:hypothetical protein
MNVSFGLIVFSLSLTPVVLLWVIECVYGMGWPNSLVLLIAGWMFIITVIDLNIVSGCVLHWLDGLA